MVLIGTDGSVRELPWCRDALEDAWSPDGTVIACTGPGQRSLALAFANSPKIFTVLPLDYPPASAPAWSPDSRYLAIAMNRPTPGIYVVDASGRKAPTLVWALEEPNPTVSWVPPQPRTRVVRVAVRPDTLTVRVGQRFTLTAYGVDDSGRVVEPLAGVRWVDHDTEVVRVTPDGALVADRPGRARIIAALGLIESDTSDVTVPPEEPVRLLHETFDQGLDRRVWQPYGFPPPLVIPGAGRGGSPGFNNDGDYSRASGVALRRPLSLTKGLTIEYWAKVPIRYPLWETVDVAFSSGAADSFAVRQGDPSPARQLRRSSPHARPIRTTPRSR